MGTKVEDVFGVSAKPVRSYVERAEVDTRFREALASDKQVIVYGSSKQGKTALVSKHLPYDKHLLVSLTPKTTVLDIYQIILSKAGIRIAAASAEKTSTEATVGAAAKVKAQLPLFGSVEGSGQLGQKDGSGAETKYEEVPVNIELPQTVVDLLRRVTIHSLGHFGKLPLSQR